MGYVFREGRSDEARRVCALKSRTEGEEGYKNTSSSRNLVTTSAKASCTSPCSYGCRMVAFGPANRLTNRCGLVQEPSSVAPTVKRLWLVDF